MVCSAIQCRIRSIKLNCCNPVSLFPSCHTVLVAIILLLYCDKSCTFSIRYMQGPLLFGIRIKRQLFSLIMYCYSEMLYNVSSQTTDFLMHWTKVCRAQNVHFTSSFPSCNPDKEHNTSHLKWNQFVCTIIKDFFVTWCGQQTICLCTLIKHFCSSEFILTYWSMA